MLLRTCVATASLLLAAPLLAQDTRIVVEPTIPASCKELKATIQASGGVLADSDESRLDTARIQKALDACPKGQAVALQVDGPMNAFLSGPLQLRAGVTLLIGKGATLYASRDPKVFETSPGSCGIVNDEPGRGCNPLFSVKNAAGAAIMGDGAIDGRGGAKLLGQTKTWWDLAEEARPGNRRQQVPRILVADHADNFTLYRITLKNSPNFHVVYNHGDGFTVWGLKIDTPQRGARNTDGVDPGGSKNITITHSFIRTGDDDVAIKGGDAISNISILHNHFFYGHGMSIGSETNGGVSSMLVQDLSLDGPDSGIRIKSMGSRGGLVQNIRYDDICIRNSPRPIDITAAYSANGPVKGNSPPTFRDITLHNVRVAGGGKIFFDGYDQTHRTDVTLDNVLLDGSQYTYTVDHADLRLQNAVNLRIPTAVDSTMSGKPANGNPESCAEKFVPFPAP